MSDSAPAPDITSSAPSGSIPWAKLAWFAALLVVLYFPILTVMVKEWAQDESMGHGFFVIPVVGYLIWQRKDEVLSVPAGTHWTGWIFLLWGFVQLIAGWFGADFFLMRVAFLISLMGLIVVLGGWKLMKSIAFPFFLLLFMVRIPLFIYSQTTFPLQLFASYVAAEFLNLIGIPVFQDGNVLELANQKLSVVEACSGIRSLLSLSFLSLTYGCLFDDKKWIRWALLAASIPIAIMANAARVSITGIIANYRKEWAEGVFHALEGWVLFMLALGALLLTHAAINLVWKALVKPRGSHV
jgi:exosortase